VVFIDPNHHDKDDAEPDVIDDGNCEESPATLTTR